MFDIETLGIQSDTAILSFACIYFDPTKKYTHDELVDSAFFAKLDVSDQISRLKRTISESTLSWWKTQSADVKSTSFTPKITDLKAEDAIEKWKEWTAQFPNNKTCTVWARGNLDQMAIGSLEDACKLQTLFHFGRWRDVRTAIDLLTGSSTGYCDIEGFDKNKVIKHNPIHDCASDIMMLLYGKKL